MAVKENGNPGVDIQLKRTQLEYTDPKLVDDIEKLRFGEPLFIESENTLLIGTKEWKSPTDSKVFKAMERNRANLYDSMDTAKLTSLNQVDVSKLQWLENVNQDSLNSILNIWNDPNRFDSANAIGKVWLENKYIAPSDWRTLDGSGNPTGTQASGAPCGIRIDLTGMTAKTRPQLIRHAQNVTSSSDTKQQLKAFGNISSGTTGQGYIIIYCSVKKPAAGFYIDLIGG